ncbi:probable E3 SUMO-protein ligase RNF212 [Lutzomyia longipalpis]|uniref:probable E3 SUMO-protein ligase RNF212 n=1 Tax=Lutzomyia longipalpis TaxID=7200 RepID=UPI0024844113|nr:probable E3 SUMO-protein ligase RNF212 [Lutzomyia longipalpis]
MTTWIHCNSCYRNYSRDHQFYMLNCSHILCHGCLQSQVIAKRNECKWCKRPVRYRKICKELDPKILQHFDPDQHKHLQTVESSLKMTQIQYKHLTNPTVLENIQRKTRQMKNLEVKFATKVAHMKRLLENLKKTPSQGSRGRPVAPSSVMSSISRSSGSGVGYFAPGQPLRKEPLLLLPSGSSGSSIGHSERSAFMPASNVNQPNGGTLLKKHPQITRISKLSAQVGKLYR